MSAYQEIINRLAAGAVFQIKPDSRLFKSKFDKFHLLETARQGIFEIYLNGQQMENELVFLFERHMEKIEVVSRVSKSISLYYAEILIIQQ